MEIKRENPASRQTRIAALARKNDLPFSVVWQAAVKSL